MASKSFLDFLRLSQRSSAEGEAQIDLFLDNFKQQKKKIFCFTKILYLSILTVNAWTLNPLVIKIPHKLAYFCRQTGSLIDADEERSTLEIWCCWFLRCGTPVSATYVKHSVRYLQAFCLFVVQTAVQVDRRGRGWHVWKSFVLNCVKYMRNVVRRRAKRLHHSSLTHIKRCYLDTPRCSSPAREETTLVSPSTVTNHIMNRQTLPEPPLLRLTQWLRWFIVFLMLLLNFSITFMGTKASLLQLQWLLSLSCHILTEWTLKIESHENPRLLLIMTCNLFSLRPIMRGGAPLRCHTFRYHFRCTARHLVETVITGIKWINT